MASPTSHLLITQEGYGSVGTIRNLTDAFTTLDATKWTASDGNVTIVSGTAQIATTSSYSNLTSNAIYDARNAITSVELLQAPNVGSGTTSAFMLLTGLGTSQRLRVGVEGGVLNAGYDPGTGSWTSLASTSYNATAHKIWRVRESGGQLYIETSSNGASWSILSGPVSTPIGFATVKVVLNSGYYGTETSPGVAQFDNFNATYVDPPPAPRVFYVSNTGADTNDGLSTGAPFQTVAKINALSLYPGDQILFQCGGTWAEALTIAGSGTSTSPITVSSYGTGAKPIFNGGGSSTVAGTRHPVEVYGSFVTLNNLEARGGQIDDFLLNGPDGIIQNCIARWGSHGIHQGNLGARALITNNACISVNVEIINPGPDDDGGAMSVLLEGDGAVVTYNTMSDGNSFSPDYGTDGSAVEAYNCTNATIAYNYATECQTFFEAGGTNAQNILVHHNVSTASAATALANATGVVVHGSDSYGPVLGVQIYHNTFVVTGGGVNGFGVWANAGAGLDLQNNIIVALGSSQMVNIGGTIIEAGNVLYGSGVYTMSAQSLDATSTIADPKFLANYTDLRISDSSPAIDRGADLGYNTDYLGNPDRGTVLDSGAYEAQASATVTLAGAGGLSSSGVIAQSATATLAGSGGLTSSGVVTKVATATLAGAGGLSSSATATQFATATLAGAGGLSSSGAVTQFATAALAGAGGLTSSATVTQFATAALAGAGGLSSSGVVTQFATATLAGAGGLSSSATVTQAAAATLVGAGGLSSTGTVTKLATAALGGSGSLTSSATVTQFGAATLAGAGGLTSVGVVTELAAATLAGAGSVAASGVVTQFSAAALSGAGGLTTSATVTELATAALAGAGALTAPGAYTAVGSVALAGTGGLAASGVVTELATAALAGAGSLTPTGLVSALGSATLAGAGSLSASSTVTQFATATLTGIGGLGPTGTVTQFASAALAGVGALNGAGGVTELATTVMGGAGGLTGAAGVTKLAAVGLAGAGGLTSAGTVITAGSTSLAGAGSLTSSELVTQFSGAALAGAGVLISDTAGNTSTLVTLTGTGGLNGAGLRGVLGTGTLAGAGALTVTVTQTQFPTVTLAADGALAAAGVVGQLGSTILAGDGQVTSSGVVTEQATATLGGVGGLASTGTVVTFATITLAGAGGVTASGVVTQFASATVVGAGSLSASGTVAELATAALAGAGLLAADTAGNSSATITLTGAGGLAAAAGRTALATASLVGAGGLTSTEMLAQLASSALAGAGGLSASGAATGVGSVTATLAGAGGLGAGGVRAAIAAATLLGSGALIGVAAGQTFVGAALAGAGSLSAVGLGSGVSAASFAGGAAMVIAAGRMAVASAGLTGDGGLIAGGVATIVAAAALTGAGALTITTTTTTTCYYVDKTAGSDSNDGITSATPWATISKVNAATLSPGATVLFRRGQIWTSAALIIGSSGTSPSRVTLGSYGSGAVPIFDGNGAASPITINGDYVTVQDVQVQNAGGSENVGLSVYGTDCLVQRIVATSNSMGVQVYDGAHRCRVTASTLSNNTRVIIGPGADDDHGANGIVLMAADYCEIDHNTISGNMGPSPDYGNDGSAVEIFGSQNSVIHHNVCADNQTFSELGNTRTSNIEYYDNLVTTNQGATSVLGLTVNGTGTYGPVTGTTFYNNTVVMVGSGGQGLNLGVNADLALHNNIIVANYIGWANNQKFDEGHNVFQGWAADIWSLANVSTNAIAPTSVNTDPLFIGSGNYRLQAGSPAIDRGMWRSYTTDLDGNLRVVGTAIDAGAYEYDSASPPRGAARPAAFFAVFGL